MKVFTELCFLKHAQQDGTENRQPEENAQQRNCHFQDYPDYKAQYQKTCNDRDGSYDLRRYYLRDKPNGTDNDGKQDSEFDEACPREAADLLERSRLLLVLIGFVRCVCLDEGRCVNVLIHDDCIHIGAFNSSRAITRCAGYTKTSVSTNSWRVERSVYLGS